MNNKTLILIGLCICLLFTLPMVSAAEISADSGLIDNSVIESNFDNVDSDIASSIEEDASMDSVVADDGDISQIPAKGEKLSQSNPDNDILSADGNGNSFTDLKILIDNAISSGNPLTLDRNFAFVEGDDDAFKSGIVISYPITIIGDNHIIDANSLARIFVIESDNVFLNGITFKNAKTTDSSDYYTNGGAVYIHGDHTTLENCSFINNTAYEKGGAIYIDGSDCILNHTVFRDNIAHDDGGAIAWYGQNGIIYDLNASGNTADGENGNPNGGTLLITGNNIHMDKLNISNSRLYKDGGERALRGGAIFLTGNNCNISNSVFTNCSVESTVENSSGGAIYVLGNNTNIVNCNFTNNTASEDGGAIYIEGKDCTLNKTVFIGNVAHNDGGAIEWNGDNGVIYDLTASRNYADCGNGGSKGGTLLIAGDNMVLDKLNVSNTFVNGEHYSGSSAVQGGALALSGNNCNITNSTFTNCSVVYYKDNSNASGGALYIWGNNTNIVNCNFTNNTASEDGGAIYIEGKDCTLNNTVFIGNVAHNDGGAIEWNGDNGRVYNLTAIDNYADSTEGYYYGNPSEGSSKGGTLVLSGNNMHLENLNISNSRVFANHYTGDKPLQGGAVFLTGNNCNISDSIFHNCSVNYNKGKSYGGAMYIIGNNANLSNCNFTNNTAVLGAGAIYIDGSNTFLDNCNVLNNSANDAGGIWIYGKENIINNTNISNNKASNNGGGVYYQGNNNTVSYSIIDHNTAINGANVYMVANMVGGKLIGCNITNGRASNFGGGVEWLQNSIDCLIKDCYFYNDTSAGHGGGVHWYPGTNGQIDNCTFESCHVDAQKNGGAIYAGATGSTAASGTIISNSKFINCTSGSRGVLTWIGNNGLIVNNTFINCGKSSGSTNYGGVQAIQIQQGKNNQIIGCNFTNCTGTLGGGAIRLQGDDKNLVDNITIADCNFDNCTAQQSAGAIYMNSPVRNVKLENNTFTDNHAPNNGALFIDDAATISSFVNNNFTNNSATASDGNGGAARLHANINVVNSTFTANSCNGSGGAIYTSGVINVLGSTFENNTAKSGGAIATENSNLVVDQSTFKYNKAESGSAISATTLSMSNTELLENQASFDKWENKNYLFTDDHLTVSGTFVGKDNLLNGIKANSGTFNNVTYCGVNGGGVGEGTTNTDDVLSANSYNEVHQIIVMEVYDVNGELKYNVSTYTDEDGNYNFDLSLDGAVVSLVKVYHPEDNYYTGAEYEIVRVPSELNIICENIYVDEVENITFKVSGSRDTPTGNITVLINDTGGNVIFNDTISLNGSGEAKISLSGLNASQYYIFATYNGDNDYLPDDETAQFNVSKWNSTVEVVPIPTITYGSLESINITVSSDATTGNFTGNLTINITSEDAIGFENISQIIITIGDDGKVIDWTINDMILPVGNYTIAVAYSGNYKYNGNSSKAKFTINKADSAVTVDVSNITYGDNETIKYNVTEGAAGTVNITVTGPDGVTRTFTDVPIANGTVGVNLADLPVGNYSVNLTYNGDNNFNPSSAVANFSVSKAVPTVNVNTTDIDYNTSEPVKVNVTGVEGGDVPTGNVTVIITDARGKAVFEDTVPITDGVVTVPVDNLPAGDYDVNVTYNGDSNYAESTFAGSFTVNSINPTVTVDPVNITYGEIENIKFNVTDGATGTFNVTVIGADGVVETFYDLPISYGADGVNVFDLAAGNYTVNVTYSGDNNFNPASAVANFTVSKATPPVEIGTSDIDYTLDETVNVIVNYVGDGDVPTGNVTVVVTNASGATVYSNTSSLRYGGMVYVIIPANVLSAGDYNVTAIYNGDANYTSATGKANFTVRAIDSSVIVDVANITYGDNETIKYNVIEGATGTVNITVTGPDGVTKTFNDVPVENGTVGVNVADLPAGNYSVNVTYNGDNNYKSSSSVANFSVSKASPTLSVNTTDIDYNTTEQVKVNVTGVEGGDVPTGNVTVIITDASGEVVYNKTHPIENGVVTVPVENLPAGDYDVNVTYNGDDNYANSTFTGSFTVNSINSTVTVEPVNMTYGADETIKYNITDGATGTVNITVTGPDGVTKTFNDVPIENGTVGVNVADLPAGNYTVNVTYNGDNNFNPSSAVANFSVSKATPTVNVNTTDIDYHDSESIKVNVTGVEGGDVPTGTVTVIVTNVSGDVIFTDTVDLSDGKKTVTVPANLLPAGDYGVNVTYNGDSNYADASNTASFTVNKIDSTVVVNTTDITYGDTETINITLPEDATGTVNVTVKGPNGFEKTFTDLPVKEDGTVTVPVEDLNAGDYTVDVSYSGDNNYKPHKETGSFSVDKSTPSVSVEGTNIDYGESETITVNVTGKNITRNVTIIIDGYEYSTIDLTQTEEGATAELNIPGLSGGKHTVKAVYNGDENHYSNQSEDQFEVSKVKPSMDVKPTDIDYGQDEDISITLTGVEGGSTPTGNVTVIVRNSSGDVVFNDTVDLSDGEITVSVEDLPSGDYNVTVTYNGDKNYTSIEDKKQFSVGKFAPTVSVNTSDIDYHESESIKVNVTGVEGGSTPTGTVTVVVTNETGGVVYNQTHDLSDGVVTVPVDDLVAGKYNVTVSYNGDDNYRHADGNANFTVNKIDPSILVNASDIDYHGSETINVTVNDDATGTVSITVKNETGDVVYSNSSELSGSKASFTVPDLSAGKYNVTVEYSGDNNYNAEIGKANFTVNKIDTPVNLETENIIYGEEETISVSVNDDATGSVTITIYSKDGTPVYSETVPIDKASAQTTVPELNAGNYTVHVDYSGDGNYKPGSADGKFEVAKADAIVEIHVYDIIYGEIEELTVTCNAPGNVTIYVNGVNITLPLEEGYGHTLFAALLNAYSGKAQWDLENLAAGTYPARVHYNGNENYNEAEDEDVFNVLKKETSVSVSVDDIKVGEDAVINVELSPNAAPGKLTITVDGKEYSVTPKNGKTSLKVPGLKAGNHTVTVSYPGSENYTDSSNETTFTVSKVKPDIDVSAPTIKVGEDGKITVTLPKDATGKVTIEIDGKNYTSQIKDGKAVFTVSGLKVGKHSIKVYYTGDDKYESSVVDGGYIKVIEDNNHGSNDHKGHANGIDLSTKATGNPVLALLFVLVFLGMIPLRRKKDEEDED